MYETTSGTEISICASDHVLTPGAPLVIKQKVTDPPNNRSTPQSSSGLFNPHLPRRQIRVGNHY